MLWDRPEREPNIFTSLLSPYTRVSLECFRFDTTLQMPDSDGARLTCPQPRCECGSILREYTEMNKGMVLGKG